MNLTDFTITDTEDASEYVSLHDLLKHIKANAKNDLVAKQKLDAFLNDNLFHHVEEFQLSDSGIVRRQLRANGSVFFYFPEPRKIEPPIMLTSSAFTSRTAAMRALDDLYLSPNNLTINPKT